MPRCHALAGIEEEVPGVVHAGDLVRVRHEDGVLRFWGYDDCPPVAKTSDSELVDG